MRRAQAESALRDFERDGLAVFRGVIDPGLLDEAREHVAWLMRRHPKLRPEQFHHTLMKDDPFWVRLVGDSRLLDVAEVFVGPDIALFSSHYICKPARDGLPVLWHQDGSYWPLEPIRVVSMWLAVDASDPENGCMRIVPGSHRMELQALQRRTDVANVLYSGMDPAAVDEARAIDVVLQPGDVSVHHPHAIHGSNANPSERRRCGLTIRYIPTTTRVTGETFLPNLFLLRGNPVPEVNEYRPLPRYAEGRHMPFAGCEAWR